MDQYGALALALVPAADAAYAREMLGAEHTPCGFATASPDLSIELQSVLLEHSGPPNRPNAPVMFGPTLIPSGPPTTFGGFGARLRATLACVWLARTCRRYRLRLR
jgi:hypothetical protein